MQTLLQKDDFIQRIQAMQGKLAAEALDAIIIVSSEAEPANVRYFTNYWPVFETAGIVIPRTGEAILLVGPETEKLVERNSVIQNHRKLLEFRESSDPMYPDIVHTTFQDVFKEINGGQPVRKIGLIGANIMNVHVYEGILEAADGAEVVRSDKLLREMRMIKSDKEIALMQRAASIAEAGFKYALERVRPGMTEIQAAAECMYGVLSQGAETPGFMIWCVSGRSTNQAIGKSTHKVIERGEMVQFTMGAMADGYVSSFGRPFIFGKMTPEMNRLLEVGLEANSLTHRLIKPGAEAADVAKQVHGHIRVSGFGDYIVYGPGHGTGMMECEYPFIESTSTFQFERNMTFAVDTFLAGPDYGMRFEDTVVVTDSGVKQLAPYRREIIEL